MSQATPAMGGDASAVSKRSNSRLPFKPPRYPSFSFRRAVSRTPDRMMKGDDAVVPDAEPTCSAPTTMSESNGPMDGKLFHVRVTLGYLKAIRRTEKVKPPSRHNKMDTSLVTAFASLCPEVSSQHNFAPSLPLSVSSSVNNVVWPKQQNTGAQNDQDGASNKSNRRLYFSTTLQPEDDDVDLRNVLSCEDDLSTVTGTSAWEHHHEETESFSPKLIKIQLGVARGKDLLHLGVATLVVDGNDVSGKQMDLPVRSLLPGEDDASSVANNKSSSPKRRGLRRLFGRKSKSAQNAFEADQYDYSLTSNALLRIRIDVISDSTPLARTSLSGPAVWGDGAEDDNDSFASIVVMDLSGEEAPPHEEGVEVPRAEASKGEASSRIVQIATDTSESIEVVNNPSGPSIISTPLKFAEPDVADFVMHDASILPITSVEIAPMDSCSPMSRYTGTGEAASMFQMAGMLCGFADAFTPPGIEADMASHDFEDSSTIATSQYKGTRGEAWKNAARKNNSKASQSTATSFNNRACQPLGTVDERTEDNTSRPSRASASRTSAHRPTNPRRSGRKARDDISIGEDTLRSLNEAKKVLQCYAERTAGSYHQVLDHLEAASTSDILSLEPSIGEATIDSIFEAKELLQSHASRVGLDVEDLLAVDLVNWDSLASPSSMLAASGSADGTEGTNTTKSSASRFSLFVDE